MKAQILEAQILTFLQAIQEAEGSDPTEAKKCERFFTQGIEFLRSEFPNPVIRRLASVFWETVGQKITPVAWGLGVKALSFVVVGPRSGPQGLIIPPLNWVEMVGKDPIMQMGALVFVGSQAIDYANDHFLNDQANVRSRAVAYEAEYLNTVRSLSASWEPCAYQSSVLREFPEGLATPKAQKITYPVQPLVFA
jgi:hypothetical protein